MSPGARLRELLHVGPPVVAPLALDPLTARLAEGAGFQALYFGGGAYGYRMGVTEANLTVTQMIHGAMEIRAVSELPIILDAACGWGEPMHVAMTVRRAEAAGIAAIEIEDQIYPKRAHHHAGLEHLVPLEAMVDKIAEAVRSRRDEGFVIIARTNACRDPEEGLDGAVERAAAYRAAGADLVLVYPRSADQLDDIARRVEGPRFHLLSGGVGAQRASLDELGAMGYRLLADPTTSLYATARVTRLGLEALAAGRADPYLQGDHDDESRRIQEAVGVPGLLEIERRTVERPAP